MKDDSKYRVSISGAGFGLDQLVTKEKLSRIVDIIFSSLDGIKINESNPGLVDKKSTSIREYLNEKMPQTNHQKIATIVSYLEKIQGLKNVSVKEIRSKFEEAKDPLPKNFTRDLSNAIASGYVAESSLQGKYYLTSSGERVVGDGFKGESVIESNKHTKLKKRNSKKGSKLLAAPVRNEILSIEIDPSAAGYPSYWGDLKTKADRALWLILQAKDKGIGSVNSRELSVLATKMNDKILSNQIVSLLNNHKKRDRIQLLRIGEHLHVKLLQPGIDYLKSASKQQKGEVAKVG